MSFLSNFNILVGILLGPTDLLTSNDDIAFSISVFSVGFFTSNQRKIVAENIGDFHWIGKSGTINNKSKIFLIFRIIAVGTTSCSSYFV